MRVLILLLTLTILGAAETEAAKVDPKLPAAAVQELKDYDLDVAKLKAKFDADVAKRAAEAAKALTKVETDATKKGDLETALAIKSVIDNFPADKAVESNPRTPTLAALPPVRDETERGKFVAIFTEANFKGQKILVRIPTAVTNVGQLSFPNDSLRSIQVPKGVTVDVYASEFGGGTKWTVTESVAEITGEEVGMTSIAVSKTAK